MRDMCELKLINYSHNPTTERPATFGASGAAEFGAKTHSYAPLALHTRPWLCTRGAGGTIGKPEARTLFAQKRCFSVGIYVFRSSHECIMSLLYRR